MSLKKYEDVLEENGYLYWKTVGISMLPLIREGKDTVLIKKRPEEILKKYDTVLFKRPNVVGRGAYVLHRITKVNNDGTYFIIGDNCEKGEIVLDENVIGVLAAVIRSGKKVSVSSFSYKLYVFFHYLTFPVRIQYRKTKRYIKGKLSKLKKIVKKVIG